MHYISKSVQGGRGFGSILHWEDFKSNYIWLLTSINKQIKKSQKSKKTRKTVFTETGEDLLKE